MTRIDALMETELERLREENFALRQALGMTAPVPAELGLTPCQGRIFAALLKRPSMSRQGLLTVMESNWTNDAAAGLRLVDSQVCKIRKKMRARGIEIETVRDFGYRMPQASKAVAQRVMVTMQ